MDRSPPYRGAAFGLLEGVEERKVPHPMTTIYLALMSFFDRDEEGQGLAEYALILALIAIIAIIALVFLGSQVSKIISDVGSSI
jgi:pilus assembly protein Flp/PilA